MNRWRKYLGLCTEALGELRYEMIESHREMCSTGSDGDNPIIISTFHCVDLLSEVVNDVPNLNMNSFLSKSRCLL